MHAAWTQFSKQFFSGQKGPNIFVLILFQSSSRVLSSNLNVDWKYLDFVKFLCNHNGEIFKIHIFKMNYRIQQLNCKNWGKIYFPKKLQN